MENLGVSHHGRNCDGLYRKRGIWYFRTKDWTGTRRAVSTRTRVYAEAKRVRRDYEDAAAEGSMPLETSKLTLQAALELWLERRALDLSKDTERVYRFRMRNIMQHLGSLPVRNINAQTMRKYQIERRREVAPATVNAETKLIISVLKEQHLWSRISQDFKSLREPKTGGRRFTSEELNKLLETADSRSDLSVMGLLLRLLLDTGMRHKEVRMLRLGSIDFNTNALKIDRDTTKTDAGERWVPLTDKAVRVLEQLVDRARSMGAKRSDHFLFPGIEFKKINNRIRRIPNPSICQANFRDAWQTLRRLAGVDSRLRIHDLRHHVASDLAEAGVPSAAAMRIMGWSTPNIRERYEHMQDSALRRAMVQMEAIRAINAEEKKPPRSAAVVIPFRAVRQR